MERREVAHQKRDSFFRSQQPASIDTVTPRLQPEPRRQPSFSSPAYSPAVSPSFSDHTSRGFYSPRGGEDDEEDGVEDDYEGEEELHEVDERGRFYRPRSPPVTTTVSRSVRVEPKVVTRVDTGAKEREVVERRVEEEGGLDFGGGRASARRRWEGRNTIVFDSGPKEVVASARRVVEEENLQFGDGRGRKSEARNTIVLDSGPKEKEVVASARRDVEGESVELREGRGRKSESRSTIVFDSGPKEVVASARRDVEEERVELRDGRARKAEAKNTIVFDSGPKEVVTAKRVVEEGSLEFRDGRGLKSEGRTTIMFDSGPKVVYESRPREEQVVEARTVLYEPKEEEFESARVVLEGGESGVRSGGEGVKPSLRKRQEGRRSEVLAMRKAALWLRVLGFVLCLISFSIMAANKNKGWALDSSHRYKEFRYCMAVSILGFAYAAAQACIAAYHLGTGKYSNHQSQFRYCLDFFMDQAISYLLISASSSAATRVEDWVSNWGRDKFPQMASMSVIVSFLAFGAFAFSSLVSGYNLCSLNVT
uniref:Casparian strip membrane protein domain-containing protein n=1 Tax=Kalanchoe fedtschenkoi TaxID=63787 RepID=A0A7N0T2K9_KALFE